MEAVRTVHSLEDKLDRLLVSFKDAKIALLEWSDAIHDVLTVSIHTYKRAPQLMALDSVLRAGARLRTRMRDNEVYFEGYRMRDEGEPEHRRRKAGRCWFV
ncbi:hypothetical protein BV20DRAFT_1055929 [Pilatotrama ljubarskyi]|nr:hypothetical protein BV20DRAFT_1055929 [Pilatotrama ljubarskyi]